MYIDHLKLMNYRNYDRLSLRFDPKLNIIYGLNAQGKTNIIEALYVCAFGKSFRTSNDKDLMKMEEKYAAAGIHVSIDGNLRKIELRWNEKGKKEIKINDVGLDKFSDLLGKINMVIFSPEDLKLVKEGPSERRKFMDREISHIRPGYYHHLYRYHQILSQRNNLLKQSRHAEIAEDLLQVWDIQLAKEGTRIMANRQAFIKRLNRVANEKHRQLTRNKENLEVSYAPDIKEEEGEKWEKAFIQKLADRREADRTRGYTTSGPHKDDLLVKINGIDVRNFGSQGQQRTAVLSLKLSEIEIVKSERGEFPVLLLDDVMSELDEQRQKELIGNLKYLQIFVTTTEIPDILKEEFKGGKIFHIEKGKAREVKSFDQIDKKPQGGKESDSKSNPGI